MDCFCLRLNFIRRTLILFVVCSFSLVHAQNLEETLEQLSASAAKSYIQPIVNTFGASLNSGWFAAPPKAEFGNLNFEVSVVGMGSYFNNKNDFFQFKGPFRFNTDQAELLTESITDPSIRTQVIQQIINQDYNVVVSGPTITGSRSRNVKVTFAPDGEQEFQVYSQDYPFPVYVALPTETIDLGVAGLLSGYPAMPSATLQLNMGTLFGTNAIVRYLPTVNLSEDLGEFSFLGIGIQHNPAVWFDYELPVDFSVGFMTQSMSLGELMQVNAVSYGLNVAKTFGNSLISVTPYGGFLIENSSVEVSYTQTYESEAGPQKINVDFKMEGENSARFNTGVSLRLLNFFTVFGSYAFSSYDAFTTGVALSFNR